MLSERAELAADAFIYGFPLVFNLQEVDRLVREGMGGVPATTFSSFDDATELAGTRTRSCRSITTPCLDLPR